MKEDAALSSPCPLAPINNLFCFFLSFSPPSSSGAHSLRTHSRHPSPATVDMKLTAGSLLSVLLLAVSLAPASSAFSDESLKDLSRLPHLQRHWLQRLEQVRNKVTTPEPPPVTDVVAIDSLEVYTVIKNILLVYARARK